MFVFLDDDGVPYIDDAVVCLSILEDEDGVPYLVS